LEKRPVAQIKHLHITYEPEINEHIIFLDCSATSYITTPTDSTSPETINIPAQEITIVFKWQRQTTNVWQDDTIVGLKFDF
jgi:hypothetical protein